MPNSHKWSRTGVVDRIEHDDPENIKFPVAIVLMNDERIELYGAPDGFGGLEEYAGVLQNLYKSGTKQLTLQALASIMSVIRDHIKEKPASYTSYYWLKALYPCGLIGFIEDNL